MTLGLFIAALVATIAAAVRCRLAYVIAAALLALACPVAFFLQISRPAATDPVDPNPDGSFRIVALGDSYMSGEGAPRYFLGTDASGHNRCHRAPTAYAYLLARELGASLTFAACSGARTHHILADAQHPNSADDVLGGRPQLDVLDDAVPADVVLVGIGGNDAGFAEIGAGCAAPGPPDCRRSAAYWLHRLDAEVYPALVRTYASVRDHADNAEVFVLNYPNPIGPRSCDDVLLEPEEISFVRDVFIERLNMVIAFAAGVARVRLIDLSESLDGHRICEVPLRRAAVNFLAFGRTRGSSVLADVDHLGGLGQGTFHPNPLGHSLMAAPVRVALNAVREDRLPPLEPPLPPELPPLVPKEYGTPVGPHPFPEGTRCAGTEIAVVTPMSVPAGVKEVVLTGVVPRSRICFRDYRGGWRSKRADANGTARVPVRLERPGIGSVNEILTEQPGHRWSKAVVMRVAFEGEGATPPPPPDRTWLYVVGALAAVLLLLAAVLAVRRCRDR